MINSTSTQGQKAPQHACPAAPPASPAARREALFITLAQVPAGSLVSYGQLAALAGLGRAARWVGRTLSQLPADSGLPWHRVLNARGEISLPGEAASRQRRLLEAEQVVFDAAGRVALARFRWTP